MGSGPVPFFSPHTVLDSNSIFHLHSITQAGGLITTVSHLGIGNKSRSDQWELHSKYPSLVIVTIDNNSSGYCFVNDSIFALENLFRPCFCSLFYGDARWNVEESF